jgi:hypothetical protein
MAQIKLTVKLFKMTKVDLWNRMESCSKCQTSSLTIEIKNKN